jgi:hypothetical protein
VFFSLTTALTRPLYPRLPTPRYRFFSHRGTARSRRRKGPTFSYPLSGWLLRQECGSAVPPRPRPRKSIRVRETGRAEDAVLSLLRSSRTTPSMSTEAGPRHRQWRRLLLASDQQVRSLDSYVELQIAQSFHVGWIHRSPGSAPCLRTASPSGPPCHSGIGFPPAIEAFRAKFSQADCFLFDRQYVLLRFSPSLLACSSFVPDLLLARTNRKGIACHNLLIPLWLVD